jgi:predicted nucleic acid-binding protein
VKTVTPAEVVVDASVAVKWFITEPGWEAAHALAASRVALLAPDFVLVELASVAAKRLRRGDILRAQADDMVASAAEMFAELPPSPGLRDRAFALAAEHGLSVYDGLYVTLAERRGAPLLTADAKLFRLAEAAGLSGVVQVLA